MRIECFSSGETKDKEPIQRERIWTLIVNTSSSDFRTIN